MKNENNQIKHEQFNLLSHRRMINKTINRLTSDCWRKILDNPIIKNRIKLINEKYSKEARIWMVHDLYKTMRTLKFKQNIDKILELFNINLDEYNKSDFNFRNFDILATSEIIYDICKNPYIVNLDVEAIINEWMNAEKIPIIDESEDHYKGTTPIKSRKTKQIFLVKKVFTQYEEIPKLDWRKLEIQNKALADILKDKDVKLDKYTNNAWNEHIMNSLLTKNHKCYTVIHINNKIDTWKIIMERKCNLIIQFNKLKYNNDMVKYNKFNFGEKNYITKFDYKNLEEFLKMNKTFINEYKGFQIPGSIKYVRNEKFGYYIISTIGEKPWLIDSGFPQFKFRRKEIKLNEQILPNDKSINIITNENSYKYNFDEISESVHSMVEQYEESIIEEEEMDPEDK